MPPPVAAGMEQPPALEMASLAEKYRPYFAVGAAVDPQAFDTHGKLLKTHFNSITTENAMKFESLQPTEGQFDFGRADAMVSSAKAQNMKVRGHALVWHRQTPDWVFVDAEGKPASKQLLRGRLESHISQVVEHFKGSVYAWDVVNEAIVNDGTYRSDQEKEDIDKSRWHGIMGKSYIAAAFRLAHAIDPQAKLFYNDYYNYIPEKRQAIYRMLKSLLADGVPVHGVGLQAHLSIHSSPEPTHHGHFQTMGNLESAIELYVSLGLEVQVTELDVSVYLPGVKYAPEQYFTTESFGAKLREEQAKRYGELFALLRKHHRAITGVTFWGIADDNTWLSEFDSKRTDFPLLFDKQHRPKAAFQAVMGF